MRIQFPPYSKYNHVKLNSVRGFGVPQGYQRRYTTVQQVPETPEAPVVTPNEKLLDHIADDVEMLPPKPVFEGSGSINIDHKHDGLILSPTEIVKPERREPIINFWREVTLIVIVMVCVITFVFVKFSKIERALYEPKSVARYRVKKWKGATEFETNSHISNEYDDLRTCKLEEESVKLDYFAH